jgi:type I restriction enzyme S subunit
MAQAIFKSWFVDFKPFGGVMPEDWRDSSIGAVCDVKGGKRLPKGENLTTTPNTHPYIRVRDMNDALFVQMTSAIEYVPDEIQSGISRYIVSADDVVISIVGTIGLTCIVHSSLDKANLTENCVKLTNCNGVMPSWLYLFLSSEVGQEQIRNVTVGAVQPKLPIKNIQSISFALPAFDVMQEFDGIVAGLLETIANNCAENARLAALRDTLLPRLMSGELSVADADAK